MKHVFVILISLLPLIAFSQFAEPGASAKSSFQAPKPRHDKQQLLSGEVRDFDSRKPIPYAAITLIQGNEAANTEDDGAFYMYTYDVSLKDTLIISCQGYISEKRSVANFVENWVVMLGKAPKIDREQSKTPLSSQQKAVLNFIDEDPVLFTGLDKTPERFTYLQLAQKLETPADYSRLLKISVSRMRIRSLEKAQQTKFTIHIYDTDPLTGGPGNELGETPMQVKDKSSEIITIKPPNYITIPGRSFFVAIEWLRIDYNFNRLTYPTYNLNNDFEVVVSPTPYIGVSQVKGSKPNIWGLNYRREWKPYTYFSPDYTDLAISAEIEY